MSHEPKEHETRAAAGEIEIDAPVERVWRALTEARELERWFPLEAEVEPGPEGRIRMSWGNEFDAWSPVEVWDAPRHLRLVWAMPGEAPVQVTDYHLGGEGGRTRLRVVTSGFPADASWDDMVEGTRLGWVFELAQLKHYLERHDGLDRRAAFLRRRIMLTREEAWARLTGPEGVTASAHGDVVDHTPPWQLALVTAEPRDGLVRFTVDPSHDEPDARDVSLFLCAWGDAAAEVDTAAEWWGGELSRLFPEGRPLDARG
jgi:uncharacterized protein YndB with AHSA1/START domain